ncbi:MAG: SGNH/GDSL hydrolase family protein [Verrucomicrobiales bacterium]|nr:SGNH/GDSL hydrolase family protein [Verrucomicrobiota bacterium JB025]
MKFLRTTLLFLTLAATASAERTFHTPDQDKKNIAASSEQREGLPNVLILGDSISIGYTRPVIKLLKGEANVSRAKANCGDTEMGLENLDKWLGDTRWDVIHFNWGLWDLCYRHPDSKVQGNRDKVNGTLSVPLPRYEQNLEKLVTRLEKTGATLIWASTTVVPENEAGRFTGDELKYNATAAKVMKNHGVTINDLHTLSAGFKGGYSQPGNVHYSQQGSALLAARVAQTIKAALPDR